MATINEIFHYRRLLLPSVIALAVFGLSANLIADDSAAESADAEQSASVEGGEGNFQKTGDIIVPNESSALPHYSLVDVHSADSLVPHGSCGNRSCQPRNQLCCADRDGHGMIGELGMKWGYGPAYCRKHQCWQCPYHPPFDVYGPGAYAGPARIRPMAEYRLRANDVVQFIYVVTALKSKGPYRLVVGDELLIESESDESINRGTIEGGLRIQPDGTLTLRFIGQVHAAGQTVQQLRELLEEKYKEYYDEPNIDVTPIKLGNAAEQVREALSGFGGFESQQLVQKVTPSGEIRLPRIGSVQASGLTIEELKQELNLRYDELIGGLEVEPSLAEQAPHFVYVLGEVLQPGRFDLEDTPTSVMGAIAMAGGYIPTSANLRQVVVFRRGETFELLSTVLDLRAPLLGHEAHPADNIWLRDGDVIVLPSTPLRLINNLVRQVFTEGVYGVIPFNTNYLWNGTSRF
jgi:protein involved in polysaccharide export with SLBB domain